MDNNYILLENLFKIKLNYFFISNCPNETVFATKKSSACRNIILVFFIYIMLLQEFILYRFIISKS